MNRLFSILCAASILYGASASTQAVPIDLEIAPSSSFDPNSLITVPVSPEEMRLPSPQFEPKQKSPFAAVGLSMLFPGLGHAYLGESQTAGALMGSAGLGIGVTAFSNPKKPLFGTSLVTLQNTWSYGIYAVYRDVRILNGNKGYSYRMPTDSFADLSYAPFKWSVMKKPAVWGGLLGALGLVAGISYFTSEASIAPPLSTQGKINPLLAFPVGLGEESFFRGYLQSQLSETFTPAGGIAVSSLLFGAVHIPNGLLLEPEERKNYYTYSIPLITGLGAYFGWLTYKYNSLQESVAIHSWYDFALFAVNSLATQSASTGKPGFAVDIPF